MSNPYEAFKFLDLKVTICWLMMIAYNSVNYHHRPIKPIKAGICKQQLSVCNSLQPLPVANLIKRFWSRVVTPLWKLTNQILCYDWFNFRVELDRLVVLGSLLALKVTNIFFSVSRGARDWELVVSGPDPDPDRQHPDRQLLPSHQDSAILRSVPGNSAASTQRLPSSS